jgi:hypothetical protein
MSETSCKTHCRVSDLPKQISAKMPLVCLSLAFDRKWEHLHPPLFCSSFAPVLISLTSRQRLFVITSPLTTREVAGYSVRHSDHNVKTEA